VPIDRGVVIRDRTLWRKFQPYRHDHLPRGCRVRE
jgi:hypothetical protein